ncbi:hypothetical protein F4803DRAFT_91344 [Xylaria telfairii]|nr:hypothetical protein F4803DRAFT_91344 [Xylaria telfairii]
MTPVSLHIKSHILYTVYWLGLQSATCTASAPERELCYLFPRAIGYLRCTCETRRAGASADRHQPRIMFKNTSTCLSKSREGKCLSARFQSCLNPLSHLGERDTTRDD